MGQADKRLPGRFGDRRPRIRERHLEGFDRSGVREPTQCSRGVLSDVPLRVAQTPGEGDHGARIPQAGQGDDGLDPHAATRVVEGLDEPGDGPRVTYLAQGDRRMEAHIDAFLLHCIDQIGNDPRIADEPKGLGRRAATEAIVSRVQGLHEIRYRRLAHVCQGAGRRVLRSFASASPRGLNQGWDRTYLAGFTEPLSGSSARLRIRAGQPMQKFVDVRGTFPI